MIRIGVCDDESFVLDGLYSIMKTVIGKLNWEADITIKTTCQDLIYNAIKNKELDIVFLDVDFGECGQNGIKFAKELRDVNKDFVLVFLTGHFEYSLLAFKCKTFDYLLKPLSRTFFGTCDETIEV